jgi:hypothetical protein
MLPRLIAITIVAAALMPSPFATRWRPPFDESQRVSVSRIMPRDAIVGEVRIDEVWRLDSPNSRFGGFSALALEGPRQFLLASDFGTLARMRLGRDGSVPALRIWPLWLDSPAALGKNGRDLESLAVDPATGTLWAGFEQRHRVARFAPGVTHVEAEAAPRAMARWNANGGAEALVRLADGRFIVMAETSGGPGSGTDALLFARDPAAHPGDQPIRFALETGGRGNITDAALLPDGRVLLLFRDIAVPAGWISTLAVADPATIRANAPWTSRAIARFERPQIAENFEGLAIEPQDATGDAVAIWMIADDNLAGWQRTLLLRLLWEPQAE